MKAIETYELLPQLYSHRYQLENGLNIILSPDSHFKTFNFQLWYHVGSSHEKKGKTGLAHFFEHMMFRGTHTHGPGQFDRLVEAVGCPGSNAFTSHDYTAYTTDFPATQMETILKLEADRMVHLNLTPKVLEEERGVILNERSQTTENDVDGLMWFRLHEMAFEKQGYHWGVIGYRQDIENLQRDDFQNFYETYYAPNNATLVMSGGFDLEKALALAQQHFAHLPRSSRLDELKKQVRPTDPLFRKGAKEEFKTVLTHTVKTIIAFPIPAESDEQKLLYHFAGQMLAGSKSSYFFQKYVTTGRLRSADYWVWRSALPGLFCFVLDFPEDENHPEILKEFYQDLQTFWLQPDEAAINRHRNIWLTQFYQGLKTSDHRSETLGQSFVITENFHHYLDQVNLIKQITASNLASLKDYFKPEYAFELTALPAEPNPATLDQ